MNQELLFLIILIIIVIIVFFQIYQRCNYDDEGFDSEEKEEGFDLDEEDFEENFVDKRGSKWCKGTLLNNVCYTCPQGLKFDRKTNKCVNNMKCKKNAVLEGTTCYSCESGKYDIISKTCPENIKKKSKSKKK